MTTAVAAQVGNSVNQAIATAVWTTVTYNLVFNDPFGMANLAVHSDRLTAVAAGLYLVTFSAGIAAGGGTQRGWRISKNGAQLVSSILLNLPGVSTYVAGQTFAWVSLAVGDYVIAQMYQDSGGPLNADAATVDRLNLSACLMGQ